jgi:hypothetical protein
MIVLKLRPFPGPAAKIVGVAGPDSEISAQYWQPQAFRRARMFFARQIDQILI